MYTIHVTDIMYDTDGEEIDAPEELYLEVDELDDDIITDTISDETGWCVVNFYYEVVE